MRAHARAPFTNSVHGFTIAPFKAEPFSRLTFLEECGIEAKPGLETL